MTAREFLHFLYLFRVKLITIGLESMMVLVLSQRRYWKNWRATQLFELIGHLMKA